MVVFLSVLKQKKIFIPKAGKDDYTLEKSYRMLTLHSPYIAKIYDLHVFFISMVFFNLRLEYA